MILPADLQLSVDFKPESPDGIIMLTGETVDMTGDYLALLLRDGYAELVLELGTGPGTVRSSQRVLLNTWNRLNVFRHDWGVWIQLNNGRHDEGRSKGLFSRITFAQPVVLGSPGVATTEIIFSSLQKNFTLSLELVLPQNGRHGTVIYLSSNIDHTCCND